MFEIKIAGENSIIIYFGDVVSSSLTDEITFYTQLIKRELNHLVIDVIPSYTSLLLSYRLGSVDYADFCQLVSDLISKFEYVGLEKQRNTIEIPVFYDETVGLDLTDILRETRLSLTEFIELHSKQQYQVHAIGFSPGFAFLGQVEQRISRPRLATPRLKIPAGSVGIADKQTAVYPMASSGGWNIIGRTPLDLTLKNEDSLQRFSIGDYVRFKAISKQDYMEQGGNL
jgi:KipI family sensor histidine kinase inhibitor